jgi:UDP-N-acetylmuramate--alanine ligase
LGLASYGGVKRRFEVRWRDDARKQMVVDDYGHHPTEVRATLAAARSAWEGRIVAVFQPHRYSRTLHCPDGFLSAFQGADVLLLTDIYAAGEEPIEGVSGEALAREVREAMPQNSEVHFVADLDQALSKLSQISRSGDLILCMGAGSITRLPEQVPGVLRA